jgi:hypothetical protein
MSRAPYFVPDDPADAQATESARLANLELSEAKAAADAANDHLSDAAFRYRQLLEQSTLKNRLDADVARGKKIHLAPAPVSLRWDEKTRTFVAVPQPQPQTQTQPQQQSLLWKKLGDRLFPFMGGRTKRSKRSKKHSKQSKQSKQSNRKGPRRSSKRHRKHF